MSQKKKKCAYRYTFLRPDKKDVDTRHDLQHYLSLLTRIKAVAGREISEADEQDKNAKSVRLPGQAIERMYLTDRGSKPPLRFSTCARCGHSLLDEPPFNKDNSRANKVVVEKYY